MRTIEAFEKIRPSWIFRISRHLARGEELRENVEELLGQFFNLIRQALETGDPNWLNSMLDGWIQSRTETEWDTRTSPLTPILNQIVQQTYDVCLENLEEKDALALIGALLPIFLHAIEYISTKETELHVEHISQELKKVTATLERLDKSKSDFIAIAAHELKTPLTLIEGYAAILHEQFPDLEDTSYVKVLLGGVDNGTRRLREIIDDMIDVSLIDNNLLSLHFQPIFLDRLLDVLRSELEPKILERRQTLEIRKFPGSEEMTFGDEERIYQALCNVVSNSIKYTPDGGKITIDGRKLPGFIELTIADTGIGIDPEDHTLIFEKFSKVGSVTLHSSGKVKFKGGGPGLGLPIAKGIIEAHGGTIWVESEGYDEVMCPGSVFHILIPLQTAPPDDKAAKLFQPLVEVANMQKTSDEGV